MTFTFRPGKREVGEGVPLLVGLVGPSGSGKTYSALRLAKGIQSVAGGKLAVIDTEARRALHYQDKFNFDYAEFGAPFSSLRYAEVLTEAAKFGAKTIVVDSMSHEHEGPGGYLETHETELDRMAGDDWAKRDRVKFTAWIKPSMERRRLINTLLQINANFVFCFRAKEKLSLQKGEKGKIEPVPIGWQAIAGEEFAFEMTVRCLLTPGCNGIPDWSDEARKNDVPKLIEPHRGILKPGRQLDEEIGRELALWASNQQGVKMEDHGDLERVEKLKRVAMDVSTMGTVALEKHWKSLSKADQTALLPYKEALKDDAAAADKEREKEAEDL